MLAAPQIRICFTRPWVKPSSHNNGSKTFYYVLHFHRTSSTSTQISWGNYTPIRHVKFSASSWSIMAVRAQMDHIKSQDFIFQYLEPVTNSSTTYMLIQSAIEQLPLVVTQCLFRASSTSEYAQLCPEAAIILQFCVALAM